MTIQIITNSLAEILNSIRTQGLARTWKIYRWKLLLVIFFYYLIRDTLIYVILPMFIFGHIMG